MGTYLTELCEIPRVSAKNAILCGQHLGVFIIATDTVRSPLQNCLGEFPCTPEVPVPYFLS